MSATRRNLLKLSAGALVAGVLPAASGADGDLATRADPLVLAGSWALWNWDDVPDGQYYQLVTISFNADQTATITVDPYIRDDLRNPRSLELPPNLAGQLFEAITAPITEFDLIQLEPHERPCNWCEGKTCTLCQWSGVETVWR